MAYDALLAQQPQAADREYLALLKLAAHESEVGVDEALRVLLAAEQPVSVAAVQQGLHAAAGSRPVTEVVVAPVDLSVYDALLTAEAA
jgi:hypothetical protein